MSFSKWIGGGLGWALGGPIGGLVGFAVGAMLDHMQGTPEPATGQQQRTGGHAGHTMGGDLTMSLVVLIAAMMKADGKVTQSELDNVRRFFVRQFGAQQAGQLLIVLRDVLKRDIPVHQVCAQIRQNMPHAVRLQLLHYLIGLAHADGRVDRAELDLLRRIAHDLGINDKDLGSLSAMFRKADPSTAYQILEVPASATDDEVKKAYRRMAMKFHPDKVAQLGEEVQKAASEKFKKVQEAYETIQRERGIA
ncbi:MAG TPA: TerB family tellurite resistance protein [Flavobacteriales bacterium]|nr:TerB family tellurite resistance protein [Flavobacteriales bacterium]HNU56159.1 TerB family tellurite resistance protein [Flavobacteriales bacterium]